MDKKETEHSNKCHICGETIDNSKKASITSWIFAENVCKCVKPKRNSSKPTALPPGKVITFPSFASCRKCGMLRRSNREGSLTAWMMGPITCECGESETLVPLDDNVPASAGDGGSVPPPDARTNITIDQRYRILDRIGSGGMSAIYRAHDIKLGKQVALKLLLGHQLVDEQVARFQQEASVVARMNHPNIIRIYDFGVFNATPYMVLQLVEGPTISEGLKRDGSFSIDEAIPALEQICDGMLHAHKLGIVHRDLKADNVMLCGSDSEPAPLILDFGICKWEQAQLTQVGDQIGSPIYMSPEQRRGESVDCRTDIYSMGCLIFEMLTGRPLFSMDDFINGNRPHLSVLERLPGENPAAIDSIIQVIDRCLRTDPAYRFQTMSELRGALVTCSTHSMSASGRPAMKRQGSTKPISRRAVVILMTVSALVSSFFFAGYLKSSRTSVKTSNGSGSSRSAFLTDEQVGLDQNRWQRADEKVNKVVTDKATNENSPLDEDVEVFNNSPEVSRSSEGVVIFRHPTPEFVKKELGSTRPSKLMLEGPCRTSLIASQASSRATHYQS